MSLETILAEWYDHEQKKHSVTIANYNKYVHDKNRDGIAEFINNRLGSRYLKPFQFENAAYKKQYKNGFSTMASCCLLIETLQSFKRGWEDSNRKSEISFIIFFFEDKNFREFQKMGEQFYSNVRCGILHQGETTGGWKIRRDGKLFDKDKLCINSNKFVEKLEKSLNQYTNALISEDWESVLWKNLRKKMVRIISNCNQK